MEKDQLYRTKVKERFDRKIKENTFSNGDMVLRFDNLWFGPFIVSKILENNTFVLQTLDGEELSNPVNGRFLKHFISFEVRYWIFIVYNVVKSRIKTP